ncbi:MAG: SCO family protein [Salibacteraceae bacterium]
MSLIKTAVYFLSVLALMSCEEQQKKKLPVLGPYAVTDIIIDGKLKTDTVFTTVRPFSFYDQNGDNITHKTIEGKVYVTDFFFTSCPTICPKMKQQMLRVHERFRETEDLVLLSHSIDPKRDSIARLKTYADKLGIDGSRWHLMTGERDSIYSMAKHYMIAAQEDRLAPGGYAHSGAFLLVDRNKQIRGIYDGTDPDDVDDLMSDIEVILNESNQDPK